MQRIESASSEAAAKVVIRPYRQKEWGTTPASGNSTDSSDSSDASHSNDLAGEAKTQTQMKARAEPEPSPVKTDSRPIAFLKGKLVSVDCSATPAAVLTVAAGKHIWKMRTDNAKKLVLVGTGAFSCDWKNQSVAVNYRRAGNGIGDLVSLEIE